MALIRSLIACKSSFLLCPPRPKRLSTPAAGAVPDVVVPGFTNLFPPGAGLLNLLPELLLNGAAISCSS
ncbi:MAG: hypothetical protein ACXVPU_09475 [Bacteroidia bacterium]